jgi:murein DD-endopeptidase MepM/ murein hydrolase activator NlpD
MSDFKFEAWPTEFRVINQYFGANPQSYAQFGLPGHEGIDFMAPDGSKVFCVAPGKVNSVRADPNGHNYGMHVKVDHQDGYQTTYAHLKQLLVATGQQVAAGTVLGLADNTGNSFGSHLHLTLKKLNEKYLNWPFNIFDPTPFILPLLGWVEPAGPFTEGWAFNSGITAINTLAQVNAGGINLRAGPSTKATSIAIVPQGTIMIINGEAGTQYTPVKVPNSAIGLPDPTPPKPPDPPPPPSVATVDGWGFTTYLTVNGNQAIVGMAGINLRAQPNRTAANIGLVKGGSTVTVLGGANGEYTPVRVRQTDFLGPFILPDKPVTPTPTPIAFPGWAFSQNLTITGRDATIGPAGINLRAAPDRNAVKLGLVKEGAKVTVTGPNKGEYTPVVARPADILNALSPLPSVLPPDPFPATTPPPPPPIPDTTPGWAFTTQIKVNGAEATVGQYGINLRGEPRRDGPNLGFLPGNTNVIVTGAAQGEYTPVRVDDRILKPQFGTTGTAIATTTPVTPNPDPPALGNARIGLHASIDPTIADPEFAEFAALRPGIIKVIGYHKADAISRLATEHPDASFVVRTGIRLNGRNVGPDQFVSETLNDVKRALDSLKGRDVVVELHTDPNLNAQGLGSIWKDGAAFGTWFLAVLAKYRQSLPGVRFLYPGLSPGTSVSNTKQDHIQFIEASRAAAEAADGIGLHLYWSSVFPLAKALPTLDDYISRFRFKQLWVTEASNNKTGTPVATKAQQYLQLWRELQKRPTVQGVTFFVASASSPAYAEEVWVGRGIGEIVGRR